MDVITINAVSKSFRQVLVLRELSLSMSEGEIFGLLGPSGAGKTTLIRLLLGLITPTTGSITVLSQDSRRYDDTVRHAFGMVLDSDGLYERLSCHENLELFARIYRIPNKGRAIADVLERVGLLEYQRRPVSTLSKGMRQRLVFARAILHHPKIVFLDEPTSGLDPSTVRLIHQEMRALQEQGTTIFLTTHNMVEAQSMCDRIALLHEGNIVEKGTPADICCKHRHEQSVCVKWKSGQTQRLSLKKLSDLLANSGSAQDCIVSVHSNEPNLEDVFIKLTGRTLE